MNTLRNQIFIVFLLVMAIVLFVVGIITFNLVSTLLKNNAEKQIQQTAVEANARLEALYRQIDTLTSQVVTNKEVQRLLFQQMNGKRATFNDRQSLMQTINDFQVYLDGIQSLDLYTTDYKPVFPLSELDLLHRIDPKWVYEAEKAKGGVVWIGSDPKDPSYFLIIRRVSIMQRWFSNGGYLLVRVERDYFNLDNNHINQGDGYTVLLDNNLNLISNNDVGDIEPILDETKQMVNVAGKDYIAVRRTSDVTGWTLIILSPVSELTIGLPVLRTAILAAAGIGFVIFMVFSVLLSTMITRPILKLIKTMRGARLGEMKTSPEINSTIELNELTKTYNQMVDHMNDLISVIYEKELVRSRTELKALQAQINPHFLYNTLDALYWSLQEKDEEELAELVVAMSELFRYTIGRTKQDEWVTLKEELEHIERYMQIMKLRFGDRLTCEISAATDCEDVRIPKLLIQPLVENAILHGIGNKKGQGTVRVEVRRSMSSSHWVIEVSDDGTGMDEMMVQSVMKSLGDEATTSLKGGGMAFANVNKRLKLYYAEQNIGGLSLISELGQGTSVTFEIPGGVGSE